MEQTNHNRKQDLIIKENQTNIVWIVEELKEMKIDVKDIKKNLMGRPTWSIAGVVSLCLVLITYILTTINGK